MINAVIWRDKKLGYLPLYLRYDTAGAAVARAQEMYEKAGDLLADLRAVCVPDDEDRLIELWPQPGAEGATLLSS